MACTLSLPPCSVRRLLLVDSEREGSRGDVVGPGNSEKARTERAVKSEKEWLFA